MNCTSCQMNTVEGFAQMPQTEYFDDKKDGYSCQKQSDQKCFYSAQGDMVCSKNSNIKENTNISGYGFHDGHPQTPTTEHFANLHEKFVKGGVRR